MDSLAANPSSGIYGQPSQNQDVMGLVNQLKDREKQDFQDKANFMSNLSIKQDRLKRLYGLDGGQGSQGPQSSQGQPMNTVMAQDPNQLTGFQKADLGIRQQQLGQEGQKIAQQGKLGQEALDVKGQQEKLNQQKSDQINAQKTADMQRKIDESNAKIEQAKAALESKNTNAEASLQAHKELAAAVEERHKLEMANMQHRFDITSDQHQKTIDNLTEQMKQKGRTKTTTNINAAGNQKTVTTERGNAADTVQVIGKDNKSYTIPKDKLPEWQANHAPDDNSSDDSSGQ